MAIKTVTFNYTGAVQSFTAPVYGKYSFAAYGASGGNSTRYSSQRGGKGGYAYGSLELSAGQTIYIHVGGQGGDPNAIDTATAAGGYNGGASINGDQTPYGAPGGGATDFRTQAGVWSDTTGLQSRILVAGGGGGANTRDDGYGGGPGGNGGGLIGGDGSTGGQNSGGLAYGYSYWTGGTQTSGGTNRRYQNGVLLSSGISGLFGTGSTGQSGGGGGWYGGAGSGHGGAGGGSSYVGSLLDAVTTVGVNSGNGKAIITYESYEMLYVLKKDNMYYIPKKDFFNIHTNEFNNVTLDYIIANYEVTKPTDLNNPFIMNGETYYPSDIIDFSKYKICAITLLDVSKRALKLGYVPSKIALSKTDIKVIDKYKTTSDDILNPFIDITANSKSNINYAINFELGSDMTSINGSLLKSEILKSDFNLSFKLTDPVSLLKSVTLYGRDLVNYFKIKDDDYAITNDYINTWVAFEKAYQEVLVNRITKQNFKYTNDTLEKF